MTTQVAGQEIADTIVQQLGGFGKLRAMVNAQNITHDEHGTLTFRFSGNRKTNVCRISLTWRDDYKVEFLKMERFTLKPVEEHDGVFCDQLKEIFESTTGLYLSLF